MDVAASQYAVVDTALGWIAVAATGTGVCRLVLPRPTAVQAEAALLRWVPTALRAAGAAGDLADRLRSFAAGEQVDFPDPVDLAGAGPFMRRVWALTRTIPRGETRSYGWLAQQAGSPRAARAVGQAMAMNPVPIVIPCHRVLGSDGRLCGFGGGLDLKARMLQLEGIGLPLWVDRTLPVLTT